MNTLTRDDRYTKIMFEVILATAAVLLLVFSIESGTGMAQNGLPSSEDERGINATTECVGTGTDSESAADIQLSSNNNTVTQECEQTISSSTGNGRQTGSNTFTSNGDSSGNQVNQQSDQKIGD